MRNKWREVPGRVYSKCCHVITACAFRALRNIEPNSTELSRECQRDELMHKARGGGR
jgi:hypothetical protein